MVEEGRGEVAPRDEGGGDDPSRTCRRTARSPKSRAAARSVSTAASQYGALASNSTSVYSSLMALQVFGGWGGVYGVRAQHIITPSNPRSHP